jgi:aralkylamine dehydrogenase heavy chain/methylamine dehydrogenase heavy chain
MLKDAARTLLAMGRFCMPLFCAASLVVVSGLARASGPQAANQSTVKLTANDAPHVLQSIETDPSDRLIDKESNFYHLTDSSVKLCDKGNGEFLGFVPTSFNGQMTVSKDGTKIYDVTTYFSRVPRGERTDVVEIYNIDNLTFEKEIEIPPKRATALNYDGILRLTGDGRFLLVQNANPGVSITVVDLKHQQFVNEITATAGCWGIIPLPATPRSFATICAEGSLLSLTLDDDGKVSEQKRSTPMFSVKDDPVFISPGVTADGLTFVSFHGNVYTAKLDRKDLSFTFAPPWSLLQTEQDKSGRWVPGGYNLMDVDARNNRLYVFMHPDGHEGSHKTPAKELWVYDLGTKRRVARIPGLDALSMSVIHGPQPELATIDGGNVHIYDISTPTPKLVRTIEKAAGASLQVMGGVPGRTNR